MIDDDEDVGLAVACFLMGTAVGAGAALLLAPGTGKATRAELARRLRDAKGLITEFASELAELTQQVADAADRIGGNVVRATSYISRTVAEVTG
jgi:gas vesicle protein